MKKSKKLKKLTQKQKADLFHKMEWEGGLVASIEHGFIMDIVKGTNLEAPMKALQDALFEAEEALDNENLHLAADEFEEELD